MLQRWAAWPALVVSAACWTATYAQDRPAARFDVATIKPWDPESRRGFNVEVQPGGRIVLTSMTLKSLVTIAFRHGAAQIANRGDAWIENDRYVVEAKPPASAGITNFNHTLFDIEDARLREMLQALLIDRFQLRVRRETRTGDIYQLSRTAKPLGLQAAAIPQGRDPSSLYSSIGYVGGRWSIRTTTMAQLAKFASTTVLRTPVEDLTNMSGVYDYTQKVPDQDPKYTEIEHTDSFLRMLNDVGLQLKRTRGPVEWLVIDSAAKPSPD